MSVYITCDHKGCKVKVSPYIGWSGTSFQVPKDWQKHSFIALTANGSRTISIHFCPKHRDDRARVA